MFIEKSLGHEVPEWPLKSWNLEFLTLVAFYNSPELDVARARWGGTQAGVITAGSRPNPSLTLSPDYSTNPPLGVSHWMPGIALDVPIETADKRGHRIAQAQYLSDSARWSIVTTAWGVRSALVAALLDYSAARYREKLLSRQVEIQEQIIGLQEGERAAGAIAGSDLNPIRIQLAKARLDLDTARAQVVDARARSAAVLGVPLGALDNMEVSFQFDTADALPLTSTEARRRALTQRSDVLGALAEYEAAQAALQGEIAKQYPNIHLGPGYAWTEGENMWSLGISLELPVFNRNQGPIAEAAAHREEAADRFTALQVQVIHELDAANAALTASEGAASIAQQLLDTQHQNLEAIERQRKAGAVGRLDEMSVKLDNNNAESLAFEAGVRRQRALRVLENAVQWPLGSEATAHAVMSQIDSTQRSPR